MAEGFVTDEEKRRIADGLPVGRPIMVSDERGRVLNLTRETAQKYLNATLTDLQRRCLRLVITTVEPDYDWEYSADAEDEVRVESVSGTLQWLANEIDPQPSPEPAKPPVGPPAPIWEQVERDPPR